mmetsp:Transcript_104872/g.338174  ORF Transcript_104872/g.338174 Transcript_104872/m.338174 type:complete len:212 (-) Transcript_104872:68-703(-)
MPWLHDGEEVRPVEPAQRGHQPWLKLQTRTKLEIRCALEIVDEHRIEGGEKRQVVVHHHLQQLVVAAPRRRVAQQRGGARGGAHEPQRVHLRLAAARLQHRGLAPAARPELLRRQDLHALGQRVLPPRQAAPVERGLEVAPLAVELQCTPPALKPRGVVIAEVPPQQLGPIHLVTRHLAPGPGGGTAGRPVPGQRGRGGAGQEPGWPNACS